MKITVLQENLHRALGIVGKAVATKTTMPVLNNILLETEKGRLKLSATNLEVGITHWLDCQIEEDGAVTIPAKLLTDFVADLPADKIEIVLDDARHILHLTCGRHEAHIKGIDASEFPVVPVLTTQTVVAEVSAPDFASAVQLVVFAAADDDSRPVLTGVLMRFDEGGITLAGTDGFRLAELKRVGKVAGTDEPPIIVPNKSLSTVQKLAAGYGDDELVRIAVTPNHNQIIFSTPAGDVVTRVIDGPFPHYEAIIPTSYVSRMVVDTASVLKAMKIASYFAKDSMNIVKLQMVAGSTDGLTPGKLTITANAAEAGDNQSELDSIIEGDGGQIAFNAKYVIDMLSAITTPQVALETGSHTAPGLWKPVGSDDYLHVIMPMNLFK